ncbi:MAG TPA: hypothetical protein VN026_09880 [Bacteroidia bacterium]|nr:hypothetical protein [Bacteroidia bacterium]
MSSHITTNYTATITPTPQLRTTRVILFKNDRLDSITTSTPPIAIATTGTNTVFDFSGTKNSNAYFFTENWYTTNLAAQIQSRVLKNIEFTQDYSLCRNYHGNVAVSSLTCSVITPPGTVQSNTAATTYSTSGKLTLTKIQSYEFQNVKIVPSYTFDYNQSVANNNPDYDPRKMDYWGYYKSDITSNGYSGYTSSTSKNYTDAWSLRKVTQPLGGYTQFDYESNSYTQVLDNTNGYRGASFIFPITTVTKNTCTNTCNYLDLTLEEGSQTPNEFLPLISGTITGLTKQACVPVGEYTNTAIGYATYTAIGYPNPFWGNYEAGSIYGKCNYTGTISPITLTTIEKEGYQNSYCITGSPTGTLAPASSGVYSYYDPACPSCVSDYYSGNGYMLFQTPVGYEVYGGGPRVKRIKTSNNSNETYVQEYTYQNGVATGEADRFEYPEPKLTCGDIYPFIYKLKPASIDKHNMGVGIGYSKVTVKNLGRSNTANGSIISNFITSYTVNGTTLTPNYQTTLTQTLTGADRVRYFECVDKYSPYWGLKTEDDVLDVNNNFVSKTTYEYQTTDQGAVIENFLFRDMVTAGAYTNRYNLSILRHYPVVLKKTKSYGVGSYMDSETLKRDQVTGEAVLMRSSGLNASTALSSKIPAFRISTFSAMGPKSVNSSNTNVLSPEAFSFSAVDTALIGNSSDFLSASALAFTNQALVMTYTNSGFVRSAITLPYWKQGASYGWAGIKGSIDSYGLYTRSELTSNPFNFATPSSSGAQWRFGSETTLSDAVGHALETRSYNNRFNSVRFGYNNDYVLATCANSNYASFTYSGFEMITPNTSNNFADGEMTLPVSAYTLVPASTITPHTGYKSIAVASGNNIYYSHGYSNTGVYETGIERGRMYRVIVWVNASAPNDCYLNALVTGSLSGSSYSQNYIMYPNDANAITIGNWKRLYVDFKVPADIVPNSGGWGVTISVHSGTGTNYFDDFMFYPVEGNIKGSVYNPGNGRVIAELNRMGYATFYTYDEAGRVLDTQQEIPGTGVKLVKRNSYNFSRTN